MRKVFKYGLAVTDFVNLPPGKVVLIGPDSIKGPGNLCFWIEHEFDDLSPRILGENNKLLIAGTGHPIPDGVTHIQSVHDGPFYWHIYNAEGVSN